MKQLTQQQKQIAIVAGVVVAAIVLGYMIGRRPAVSDMTNTSAAGSTVPTQGSTTAPNGGTAVQAPTGTTGTKGTTASGTTTTPAPNTDQPVAAPAKAGSISLAAKSGNGGISFSWSLPSNLTSPFGYYIYKSTTSSPSFPRDEAKYIADPNARSYNWDIQDGGTYWFKMCTWNGKAAALSGCLTTSNAVKATAPTASASQQQNPFDFTGTELGLTGRTETDGIRLFWSMSTVSGFTGYKVVRSATDTNPYYPKNEAIISLSNKTDVGAFDSTAVKGAKYFYRVCATRTGANPQCGNVWTVQN